MENNSSKQHELIDKITDKIYLGCTFGANDTNYFQSEKITHILSVVFVPPSNTTPLIRKSINIRDDSDENIFKYFKEAIEFIEGSEKVYVHCMAGVSRSPTIVIAYLMWKNKMPYYNAYWKVANIRRFIYPNDGFKKQLSKFEKALVENDWNLDKINFDN